MIYSIATVRELYILEYIHVVMWSIFVCRFELVDPEGYTEEQLRDIPFTNVE